MADVRKSNFIVYAMNLSTSLLNSFQRVDILADKYTQRGYAPAGSNPITDADLVDIGITRAQFDELVGFYTNLRKFLDNQVATQKDYRSVLSNYSNDQY